MTNTGGGPVAADDGSLGASRIGQWRRQTVERSPVGSPAPGGIGSATAVEEQSGGPSRRRETLTTPGLPVGRIPRFQYV